MRHVITRHPSWIALVVLWAWSCTPKAEPPAATGDAPAAAEAPAVEDSQPTRTLRRAIGTPQALDPARAAAVGGATIIGDLFEGLYRVGPGGAPVLAAAERHDVSPDGLTHTFTLREKGRWSDGAPVTADDFVFAWLRALDPALAAAGASTLHTVAGARAYNRAVADAERAALKRAVGLEARDPRTLVMRLTQPDPHLSWRLTRPAAVPVQRAQVEAHPDDWLTPERAVTNGPWTLSALSPGQRVSARRNPHFADGAPVPFDAIEYVIVEDETAAYNLYRTDKLDYVAGKVPASAVTTLRREGSTELRVVPFAGVDFYLVNTTRAPFDDPRVREALSLAIDRAAIGHHVLKSGELPAESLVPPSLGGDHPPSFDPARAKALLAEAGYGPERPLRRFTLAHDQGDAARRLAEYAQQQWKKNLGVDCDVSSMERKVLLGQQRALDYDLSRAAWFADVPDPAEFLDPWTSDSRANRSGWKSAAFDQAAERLSRLTEPVARQRAAKAAEALLIQGRPAIPTYVHVRSDLVKPYLLGHDPSTGTVQPSRLFRFSERRQTDR